MSMVQSNKNVSEVQATETIATAQAGATCTRNTGCHFAHGSEELRAVSENSGFFEEVEKPNTDYLNKWPTNIPTNYKTSLCKFYEQVGTCKYDQNCNFAHGDQEQRQISENVQSQLKNARSSNKHINNSAGQRNQQQGASQQQVAAQQQLMQSKQFQLYIAQLVIGQQLTYINEVCKRLKADSTDEYMLKSVGDVKKLGEAFNFKQAFQQIKKLCSRKDSTAPQKEILKEVDAYLKYLASTPTSASNSSGNSSVSSETASN